MSTHLCLHSSTKWSSRMQTYTHFKHNTSSPISVLFTIIIWREKVFLHLYIFPIHEWSDVNTHKRIRNIFFSYHLFIYHFLICFEKKLGRKCDCFDWGILEWSVRKIGWSAWVMHDCEEIFNFFKRCII